jgi:hypothetical protein
MLAFVGGALHQSKIPASPELAAASAKYAGDQDEGEPVPSDVRAGLDAIFESCGDPFMVVDALTESSHAMPAEARCTLAGALALAGIPEAREAAVLLLLDPDSAVRRTVAGAIGQVAASLTPTDVRRLIAMRNWRPENERAEVDAVIRKARAAGIDCAQWETSIRRRDSGSPLHASAIPPLVRTEEIRFCRPAGDTSTKPCVSAPSMAVATTDSMLPVAARPDSLR